VPVHYVPVHESILTTALAPRMRWFAAVGRIEHVTQAASELGVPQPTLSRGIARLESELGIALFTRSGRVLRLTREGRLLLRYVERSLAELDAGEAELNEERDLLHGKVSLGFLPTLGTALVPRLLSDFRIAQPGIRFSLMQDTHAMLLRRLREGEADLALTAPLPDASEFDRYPLGEEEVRLAVPADHRLAAFRDGLPLSAAAAESFIGFSPGYGLSNATEAWCREAGFSPRMAFEGGDTATLRGLVGAGLGISLLPMSHGDPPPGVVELSVTEPRTTRTVGLVRLLGHRLSPPARAFAEFVRERPDPLFPDQ
jgi:DNA-binding transcriptional LysR family regulator